MMRREPLYYEAISDRAWFLPVVITLVVALLGGGIWWTASAENRALHAWRAQCEQKGGHVTDHTDTSTVVTVGSNGKPGVGVSTHTTYYCLSEDGRILGIR